MRSIHAMLVALALGASACATAATIRLPDGPWTDEPSAAGAFESASAACRSVRTLTAELGVRGNAGRSKIRGRVLAGFQRGGSLRLEAPAPFGAPVFILVARANRATLLLPRDRRILRDVAVDDVLDAITGLRRSSDDVLALLAGCLVSDAASAGAGERSRGGWLRVGLAGGVTAFLAPDGDRWRVAAGQGQPGAAGSAWSVSYAAFASGFPAAVTIRQEAGPGAADTALTFRVSQLETNVPIDPRAFDVIVPSDAQLLTLEELRQSGPLADRGGTP